MLCAVQHMEAIPRVFFFKDMWTSLRVLLCTYLNTTAGLGGLSYVHISMLVSSAFYFSNAFATASCVCLFYYFF